MNLKAGREISFNGCLALIALDFSIVILTLFCSVLLRRLCLRKIGIRKRSPASTELRYKISVRILGEIDGEGLVWIDMRDGGDAAVKLLGAWWNFQPSQSEEEGQDGSNRFQRAIFGTFQLREEFLASCRVFAVVGLSLESSAASGGTASSRRMAHHSSHRPSEATLYGSPGICSFSPTTKGGVYHRPVCLDAVAL